MVATGVGREVESRDGVLELRTTKPLSRRRDLGTECRVVLGDCVDFEVELDGASCQATNPPAWRHQSERGGG
jgi:predicted methyltransferase